MPSKTFIALILLITVSVVAVVRIPRMAGPMRKSAFENAAIATLRFIAEAQESHQRFALRDENQDGTGEFGFLAQLTRHRPRNSSRSPAGQVQAASTQEPTFLPTAFKKCDPNGCVTRTGYIFRVHLPGQAKASLIPGLTAGSPSPPDPIESASQWSAYAWPDTDSIAERCFFLNQAGLLTEIPSGYAGLNQAPSFDAALSRESPGHMGSAPVTAGRLGLSNDGLAWKLSADEGRPGGGG